jgi:hypothetical protein
MTTLRFDVAGVKRLIAHAKAAPDHSVIFGDKTKSPALTLVKDDGIYLMSNGLPRDLLATQPHSDLGTDHSFVVYAKGYAPSDFAEGEMYEKCRAAVGGDDFCERVPLDDGLPELLNKPGVVALVIGISPTKMSVGVLQKSATKKKGKK